MSLDGLGHARLKKVAMDEETLPCGGIQGLRRRGWELQVKAPPKCEDHKKSFGSWKRYR